MRFGLTKSAAERLEVIDIALATMGGLVEQQVADALDAFERGDIALAASVCARDASVDTQERDIEYQVVLLLEQRRPSGSELRRAMTAIKIAAEMERIGDLAKNIAKRTSVLAEAEGDVGLKVVPTVSRMGRRALTQFREALDALFKKNEAAALAVREADDQIDDLYNSVFRELLVSMGQYSAGITVGTHLVFVAKNVERIGDHATNIAERVHYTLTGEVLSGDRPKSDRTSLTNFSEMMAVRAETAGG